MKEKEEIRLKELKKIENELQKEQKRKIAGIDEAGRGPLAGPVVIASVIMPEDSMIEGVNDSKKISEKKREILYEKIIEEAISYSAIVVDHKTIDEINILNATKQGLTQSIKELKEKFKDVPILIGSGIKQSNVKEFLQYADGIIIGSSIKIDNDVNNGVDLEKVKVLMNTVKDSQYY